MNVTRRLAALASLLGVFAFTLIAIALPVVEAFSDQHEKILSLRQRLDNLNRPPEAREEPPITLSGKDQVVFLVAANTEQAGAELGGTISSLIGSEATLISAVPSGSSTTQLFVDERFEVSLQMPEAALSGFVSRVETARPTLRFARLSARRAEQHNIIIVDASIAGFRKVDALAGANP